LINLKDLRPNSATTKKVLEALSPGSAVCAYGALGGRATSYVCSATIDLYKNRRSTNFYHGPTIVSEEVLCNTKAYQRFVLDPKRSPYSHILSLYNVHVLAVKWKRMWFPFGIWYRRGKKLNNELFRNMLTAIRYYGEFSDPIRMFNFIRGLGYSDEVAFALFLKYNKVEGFEWYKQVNTNHSIFNEVSLSRVVRKDPRFVTDDCFFDVGRGERDRPQCWDIWGEKKTQRYTFPTQETVCIEDLVKEANRLEKEVL